MKKFIIPIISGIIGIIIPVAGMTISPTRNLILGLAPDEAVLRLADKIDADRINIDSQLAEKEQKIQELELALAAQQTKIFNQEDKIDGQKAENQAVQMEMDNEVACRKLYAENDECNHKNYKTKSSFDNWMDTYKQMDEDNDGKTNFFKKNYDEKYPVFQKCQNIYRKCD